MKVVILAGGVGSRLSEETESKPKPMVEIGGRPILWHIMKHYAHHGYKDFVICLGYKGSMVKRYFADQLALAADLTFDFSSGNVQTHSSPDDDWTVTLVDTGERTQTGGRLLRIRDHLTPGEPFLLTYGDGVSDIDLAAEVDFHRRHGRLVTVTAVRPLARFGHMELAGDKVERFDEKPQMDQGWINGGFFVVHPDALDHIRSDCDWSKAPLESVAAAGELMAYRHDGFWQCMDTLRDRKYLEARWTAGDPPWRTWK